MPSIFHIDVKQLFQEKNPGLARLIPGFVYRYINHIMHLNEINEIIEKYGDQTGVDFVHKVVQYFGVQQKVFGIEQIPRGKRYIFVSNHPLGGFDGLLLISNVHRAMGSVRFLVNDLLMKIPQFEEIFVPLNKHGANSRDAVQNIEQLYASDQQILIFPSGLASRKHKGVIEDTEWKKHFIQKAISYQRDVVPVYISGKNSDFFYRLASLRKALKIKWNLEMFFLSNETFHHKGQEFTLTFGKPIPYQTFNKSRSHKAWAKQVKEIVYQLSSQA